MNPWERILFGLGGVGIALASIHSLLLVSPLIVDTGQFISHLIAGSVAAYTGLALLFAAIDGGQEDAP